MKLHNLFLLLLTGLTLQAIAQKSQEKLGKELRAAARYGNIDVALKCIAAGAPLNGIGSAGSTALILAARNGHASIVNALIEAKVCLDIQDNDGCTALMGAVIHRHPEIVSALIKAKAGLDIQDNNGYTALMEAARLCRIMDVPMVEALIGAGAGVNFQTKSGYTALMWAVQGLCEEKDAKVVALLLKANADPSKKNYLRLTALELAEQQGHAACAALLRQAGSGSSSELQEVVII